MDRPRRHLVQPSKLEGNLTTWGLLRQASSPPTPRKPDAKHAARARDLSLWDSPSSVPNGPVLPEDASREKLDTVAAAALIRPHQYISSSYGNRPRDTVAGRAPGHALQAHNELSRALANVCSGCGVLLPAGTAARCPRCTRPQRSGSSRPELNRSAWQRLRRAARLRDEDRCVHCGSA